MISGKEKEMAKKAAKTFSVQLRIWRQTNRHTQGRVVQYQVNGITADMTFLDMLEKLNEKLLKRGEIPVVFEANCREGSCGTCGLIINGEPHGPGEHSVTCRLTMKNFNPDDIITVEPWRIKSFPIVKDLATDRKALDRICEAGGFISANLGSSPEANAINVPKEAAEEALAAASCTGCGACIAACPNGSAALFVAAKLAHLSIMPQGEPEKNSRAIALVRAAEKEGFGPCCNNGACEKACPRGIKKDLIAKMHRAYLRALLGMK